MQTLKKIGVTLLGLSMPLMAAAQTDKITPILNIFKTALNTLIIVLAALLMVYFIWGVIQYVSAGGDEEKLKAGKKHMLWGIIGIAVVGAVFGITNWLYSLLGVTATGTFTVPSF
jgi:predicted membrane protein